MHMYTVDAFTNQPFRGNPAAVCMLDGPKDTEWMQQVAREMNLSETAFLVKENNGYQLRWFTPTVEVDLCGHATLASAHILWEMGYIDWESDIHFYTKSGFLIAKHNSDEIELDFPAEPPQACAAPELLLIGLDTPLNNVGKNRLDYIVEVESQEQVQNLKPNFHILSQVKARGIIVTSTSSQKEYDFVSRCFYPALGVNEDPVTGSAHCCLGPYWKSRLHSEQFKTLQLSERRGELGVRLEGKRVILSGQAVTVMKGTLVHQS